MNRTDIERAPYEGWSILELLGHRRLAGYVHEEEIAGHGMLRIEIPGEGAQVEATQFYSPAALYCLTPTTEEIARAVAKQSHPEPVQPWELRQLEAPKREKRVCARCRRLIMWADDSDICDGCAQDLAHEDEADSEDGDAAPL